MKIHTISITIRSLLSIDNIGELLSENYCLTYINETGRRLTKEEIITHCQNAEVIIAGTEPFDRDTLNNLPSLKIISRVGVGIDSIDTKTAKERGISILTTPISPVPAVAEHTISLLLAICKKIPDYLLSQRSQVRFSQTGYPIATGDEEAILKKDSDYTDEEKKYRITPGYLVNGKIVGIIGLGRIGFEVARILTCFGARIMYYDPHIGRIPDNTWECSPSLPYLLEKADIITIHTPPLPDNKPLLDREMFTYVKKGAILINAARGSLIDENALIESIEDNTIIGAGLDTLSNEPYSGPLLNFPSVIITPHVASNTYESRKQMEIEAIQNIFQYYRDCT